MPEELILPVSVLVIWGILLVLKKLRTKKGDVETVIFVAVLAAFVLFDVLAITSFPAGIINIALYGGFAVSLLLFNVRSVFGKDMTKSKLLQLKKDFRKLNDRSEMLRQRFVTLLDLSPSGIMFRSEEGDVFATDKLVELFNLSTNELSFDTLCEAMHPEDKRTYIQTLERTGKKRNTYSVHYRMRKENGYMWFKEDGTYVKHKGKTMFIALVNALDIKTYPKSNIEVLNNLVIDEAYYEHLQALNRRQKPYTIVTFEITNIPQINTRYGRDIGDLMMGEYLSKLSYQFLRDIHSVFRLSGIRFAMVIEDQRKAQMLKRALEDGGEMTNYTMQFGAAKESVYPAFGILDVSHFDEPVDELASRADKALEIALDDNTQDIYFTIR